ncbi:hypothetical protein KUC_0811 [Vreelandella boliviensis LC1]|uniref:Uncharacterized protein n=1 Tax=Vreelandella boliviensis LC1 TaxID=1072583 RepID=A0A7U9C268_9GAMM|nr:hypothetical protein KUC_0811 [Halomonas boliviensis LC1]
MTPKSNPLDCRAVHATTPKRNPQMTKTRSRRLARDDAASTRANAAS